jgi:hypothetical protein
MSADTITFIAQASLDKLFEAVADHLVHDSTPYVVSVAALILGLEFGRRSSLKIDKFFRGLVTPAIRDVASSGLSLIDSHPLTSEELAPLTREQRVRGIRRHQLACSIGVECRAKFGFRVRNEANEIIARKWIHDQLHLLADMRKADIPHIIPYGLEVAFTPSIHEIRARAVTKTRAVQNRLADAELPFWDWGYFVSSRPAPLSG